MIKFIAPVLLVLCFNCHAQSSVSGNFEATQSCSAYLSKNKKTNPEHFMVYPGQDYKVVEINKYPPDWFRIELPSHNNARAWVSATCGIAEFVEQQTQHCDERSGMADSHILALSSQSGFCETYGYEAGKPECRKMARDSYQANHLTLHGLWPNRDSCGQRYGFCGVKPKANHCDYSPVNLIPVVAEELKKLMPSYFYGSCLERHEWNKHGSCTKLNADEYFALAMRLTTEINESAFGVYLTEHQGEEVKLSALRERISEAFGKKNANKIYLGCTNGKLVDVFVQLPALIPSDESLDYIISNAPDSQHRDSCAGTVSISKFNKELWF